MADNLEDVAPGFVEMAHRIVWATTATVDTAGNPSTRILHPVWEWDGLALTGWIATSPKSVEGQAPGTSAAHLVDLLAAESRHLFGDVCDGVGGVRRATPRGLATVRRGSCAGRVQPIDRPWLGFSGGTRDSEFCASSRPACE